MYWSQPALHCLCHYAEGTAMHGILKLFWMMAFERWNKKCKNLTANKHLPFQSLGNSLVRDATCRFFRWRRRAKPTRVSKIPVTNVSGTSLEVQLTPDVSRLVAMPCSCRAGNSTVYSHSKAVIGGKEFNAGEPLKSGRRCGSVVTCVVRGRSLYGLVKRFLCVVCQHHRAHNFAVVTWFRNPVYPDGDPLTVRIPMNGVDVNNINQVSVVSLYDIQPCRVLVDIDRFHDCMYMMRKEGMDTSPDF